MNLKLHLPGKRPFVGQGEAQISGWCEVCRLEQGIVSECVADHNHEDDPDSCVFVELYCSWPDDIEAEK